MFFRMAPGGPKRESEWERNSSEGQKLCRILRIDFPSCFFPGTGRQELDRRDFTKVVKKRLFLCMEF